MSGWTLLLDGAMLPAKAGLLKEDFIALRRCRDGAPAGALFTEVEELLEKAGLTLAAVTTFLLCRGPGNATGLRFCKMLADGANAIGPSRPALFYDCLELAAWILEERGYRNFTVAIAVSKRLVAVRDAKTLETPRFLSLSSTLDRESIFFLPSPIPIPTDRILFSFQPEEALPFFREKLRNGVPEPNFSLLLPPAQFQGQNPLVA